MPIIPRINASVHPPHETVDRVDPPPSPVIERHVPSLFVRFSFVCVAFGQSVHFIFNSNFDALSALHHDVVALSHISDLLWLVITLPINSLLPNLPKVLNLPHICILLLSAINKMLSMSGENLVTAFGIFSGGKINDLFWNEAICSIFNSLSRKDKK